MSLQSIVTDLASEGGIRVNDETQLNLIKFRINRAAEELFNQTDLVGCLREQIYEINNNDKGMLITLPHYVGKVRAVRSYSSDTKISLVDMRPRYAGRMWQSSNWLSWRMLGEYPLFKDIENASLIKARFKAPLTAPCKVTIEGIIIGATGLTRETLDFNTGDQEKVSLLSFDEITNLTKSVATAYDLEFVDVDDMVLSLLANNQLKASYQLIQVTNPPNNVNGATVFSTIDSAYVEVLWKQKFRPLIELTDEFQCPNYDQAIFWMYKKQEALRGAVNDVNLYNAARAYKAQCDEIIKNVASDFDQNLDKYINFGPNPFISAQEELYWTNSNL